MNGSDGRPKYLYLSLSLSLRLPYLSSSAEQTYKRAVFTRAFPFSRFLFLSCWNLSLFREPSCVKVLPLPCARLRSRKIAAQRNNQLFVYECVCVSVRESAGFTSHAIKDGSNFRPFLLFISRLFSRSRDRPLLTSESIPWIKDARASAGSLRACIFVLFSDAAQLKWLRDLCCVFTWRWFKDCATAKTPIVLYDNCFMGLFERECKYFFIYSIYLIWSKKSH